MTYRAADEDGLVITSPAVACKDVCGEDAADEVAEMRNVVDIGQGTGDEDVALPLHGEDRSLCGLWRRHDGVRLGTSFNGTSGRDAKLEGRSCKAVGLWFGLALRFGGGCSFCEARRGAQCGAAGGGRVELKRIEGQSRDEVGRD